jgi:hypothetical protein
VSSFLFFVLYFIGKSQKAPITEPSGEPETEPTIGGVPGKERSLLGEAPARELETAPPGQSADQPAEDASAALGGSEDRPTGEGEGQYALVKPGWSGDRPVGEGAGQNAPVKPGWSGDRPAGEGTGQYAPVKPGWSGDQPGGGRTTDNSPATPRQITSIPDFTVLRKQGEKNDKLHL